MTAPAAINPFARAKDMLAALEAREISSRELTELHIERIERLNPPLNAVVIPTFERARAMAADAGKYARDQFRKSIRRAVAGSKYFKLK